MGLAFLRIDSPMAMQAWARADSDKFFAQRLPKAMAAKPESSSGPEGIVEDRGIEEIERITRLTKGWEESLSENAPAVVKDNIKSLLADWFRRCGLDVSRDAVESLQHHVAYLVDNCIVAVLKNPQAFQRVA